jgi:hypothetical protein
MAETTHKSQVHGGLERKPGKQNWIEHLPAPLRARWHKSWAYRAAKHLHYDAKMNIGRAIAVAINAARKGCTTGDLNWPGHQSVNPGSRAEMCASVATWSAMKAYNKRSNVDMANDLGEEMLIELAYINAKARKKALDKGQAVKSSKAPGGGGYPIRNKQDAKDAEKLFKTHRGKYSAAKKRRLAQHIRRNAAKQGVKVNLSNIELAVPFQEHKVRRQAGKFVNKGAKEANPGFGTTTVSFTSAVRNLKVGESVDLPGGKGVVKRLKHGWQVRSGDGKYNKIFAQPTDAVSIAARIARTRFGRTAPARGTGHDVKRV